MSSTFVSQLNFGINTYLAVYLSPSSHFLSQPALLGSLHPYLSHLGPLGVMHDVQILSAPKDAVTSNQLEDILAALQAESDEGIIRVEILKEPQQRSKRDEF